MWHVTSFGAEFFDQLVGIDEAIARRVAAAGCPRCGGPLHRGDYDRKPRGAVVAVAGEAFSRRFSLCCGREGCRKRAMPPSVRFLGRRIYLEVIVLLACVRARLGDVVDQGRRIAGVPARTVGRWCAWWTSAFPATSTFLVIRARVPPPPPDEDRLPLSFLERLPGADLSVVLVHAARWLAPLTTRSLPDSTRFVWGD